LVLSITSNFGKMTKMEYIDCPNCQGTRSLVVHSDLPDRMLNGLETRTTLVRCINCGLVYQNPRPTLSEMGAFYPDDYECYQDVTSEPNASWLMQQAYTYGLKKRLAAVQRWKKGGRLLDVGCASGVFLHFVQSHPEWSVNGIEISPTAAEYARGKYGLDVFTGTLEDRSFPENSFDAVTLWDVLEHLHEPLESLHEVFRVLKPGGIVVSRVPNGNSWDANLFGKYWAGIDAPRHLFVFDQSTLSKIFCQAGFTPLTFSTNGGSYPTFLFSLRFYLADKLHQPELGKSDHTWIRFLYSPVARLISAPLFSLSGIFKHGPLMIVVARKPSEGISE
jgi:SAM-dependent methyltransferase